MKIKLITTAQTKTETTPKSGKRTSTTGNASQGFSAEEKAAARASGN